MLKKKEILKDPKIKVSLKTIKSLSNNNLWNFVVDFD